MPRALRFKARGDYYFKLLKDPKTGRIPANIRTAELAFARQLQAKNKSLNARLAQNFAFDWNFAGPDDVGGRTRALGIDSRNANIILAGGVSGGMWKSTDGGGTWQLKTDPSMNMSVTSVVQDPANPDTWFYTTGENTGNTASDRGSTAFYFGAGIFRSTDNGESWELLSYEKLNPFSNDDWQLDPDGLSFPTSFDNPFYLASKIVISPITGSIFVASHFFGLYRSTDDGNNFTRVLGTGNNEFIDLVLADNGDMVAVLSGSKTTDNAGVHRSTDDGDNWVETTPSDFPEEFERSVLALAPSNQNILYVYTTTGSVMNDIEDVRFYKFDLGGGTAENRSNNLPNFGNPVGNIDTQDSYNMVLAVKPDDENFVLLGHINLYVSSDGFATKPSNGETWVGGYDPENDKSIYPNQHPDQHVLVFEPQSANIMWSGHDGGLSRTLDISADSVLWQDKNNGYNVTQYYTIALPGESEDFRILGGTQDNGSPFMMWDPDITFVNSEDVSSGDGGFALLGDQYALSSTQNGNLNFHTYDQSGSISNTSFDITPSGLSEPLFIHPFAVDPVDQNYIYFPDGSAIWRNDVLETAQTISEIRDAWEFLPDITAPSGYQVTAIAVSRNPEQILYFGASRDGQVPKIFRLENARTANSGATEISVPDVPAGAYVHDIAINPEDADEVTVIFSNYNIIGIYHSTDGGLNYSAVEGNLEGTAELPGPSIRKAQILPFLDNKKYLLATSTGLYSTALLNSNSTVWEQEAVSEMGNPVVESLASRITDGVVAAGTHGRGVFVGIPEGLSIPSDIGISNIMDTSFQVSWNPVAEAESYQIIVATDSLFSDPLADFNNLMIADTFSLVTGLLPDANYFLKVRSSKGSGKSAYSPVFNVLTNLAPPVTLPPAEITSTTFTLTWTTVSGATFYEVDVDFSEDFSNVQTFEVADTIILLTDAPANTELFYRLRASDTLRTSRNSDTVSFFTDLAPPEAFEAFDVTSNSFTVAWSSVEDAASYLVEIDMDTIFENAQLEQIQDTVLTYIDLPEEASFFYRVRAADGDSARISDFSNVISVTTLITAVDDFNDRESITIFPNPTSSYIQLRFPPLQNQQPLGVEIIGVTGKPVFRFRSAPEKVNEKLQGITQKLPAGMYLLRLDDKSRITIKKFLKR